MGTVIGPIDREDWNTIRDFRASVKFYEETNREKFKTVIQKEKGILNKYYNKYKIAA